MSIQDTSTENFVKSMTGHLADVVFQPVPQIAQRARAWGLTVVSASEDELIVRSPDGFTGGLTSATDPINRAVILGFALIGPFWPHAFPTLLEEVQRRWKARTTPQPQPPSTATPQEAPR